MTRIGITEINDLTQMGFYLASAMDLLRTVRESLGDVDEVTALDIVNAILERAHEFTADIDSAECERCSSLRTQPESE